VLARISGRCWVDKYELRRWSNVVCAVRGGAIEEALAKGSYLSGGQAKVGAMCATAWLILLTSLVLLL
jgi:hypothetical protein